MCLALQGLSHIGIQFRLPAPPTVSKRNIHYKGNLNIIHTACFFTCTIELIFF